MKSKASIMPEKNGVTYPCLAVGNEGLVVLLTSPSRGIVVVGNRYHHVGKVSDNWCFSLRDKTKDVVVTLSNF